MSLHCYSAASLAADYLRSAGGLILAAAPLLFMSVSSVMLWILGACAVLFMMFGIRTALRHASCVELSASGVRTTGPFGAVIKWEELRNFDVRYYSTRKDRTRGWMQLTLSGPRQRIRVDSAIGDFTGLARQAAAAAAARRLPLSASSRANLAALGIAAPSEPAVR